MEVIGVIGMLIGIAWMAVVGWSMTCLAIWAVSYAITGDPPDVNNKRIMNRITWLAVPGGLWFGVKALESFSSSS